MKNALPGTRVSYSAAVPHINRGCNPRLLHTLRVGARRFPNRVLIHHFHLRDIIDIAGDVFVQPIFSPGSPFSFCNPETGYA
jgi:hypothetical protein